MKTFLAIIFALAVAAFIGAAMNMSTKQGGDESRALATTNKAVEDICKPTNFKDQCVKSLNEAGASNTSDPKQLLQASFQAAKKALIEAVNKSGTIQAAKTDARALQGLEICREVMTYAMNDLEKSVNSAGNLGNADDLNRFMEDLKVWMGGVLTYQDVCFDAFANATETQPGQKMRQFFNVSRQLTSNALGMMDQGKQMISLLDLKSLGLARRLLVADAPSPDSYSGEDNSGSSAMAGVLPPWMKDDKRKLMQTKASEIKADATVGNGGQYKTITEALKKYPNDTSKPYVIHIKEGTYKENVTVEHSQTNVVFIGDGATKTIITGSRNFVDGLQTYKTATVGVLGDGFMARDIGFQNTAGAEKHQAVAVRVTADFAIFYNCDFDGYQDTLYAVRGRQFYRNCNIKGTIDFIFGDAQAMFQSCKMLVKKPMENQQCAVTAQGRTDPNGPGATILQNCTITADSDHKDGKSYLGRPWKKYSRTIIMQSYIDKVIDPTGWEEWSGSTGTDSLYYAEFKNRGPGSDTSKRVKWKGIQDIDDVKAKEFTADVFFKGSEWVNPSGAPYSGGMMSV